jgi:hypothetical protein
VPYKKQSNHQCPIINIIENAYYLENKDVKVYAPSTKPNISHQITNIWEPRVSSTWANNVE